MILPLFAPNPTGESSHIEMVAPYLSHLFVSLFYINPHLDQPLFGLTQWALTTPPPIMKLFITSLGWHLLTVILVVASFGLLQVGLGWFGHQIQLLPPWPTKKGTSTIGMSQSQSLDGDNFNLTKKRMCSLKMQGKYICEEGRREKMGCLKRWHK